MFSKANARPPLPIELNETKAAGLAHDKVDHLIPAVRELVPMVQRLIDTQAIQGKQLDQVIAWQGTAEERHLEMLGAVHRAEGAASLSAREAHAARTGDLRASMTNEINQATADLAVARRHALARFWRKAPVWADRAFKLAVGALAAYWAIKH